MKRNIVTVTVFLLFTAFSIYAQSAQTRLDNGKKLFDQKNYDGAIQELTEAIKLDPKLAEAYVYRSRSYNSKNDYDQGLSDANKAIQLNPKLALGYFARGRAYDGKNDIDYAITDYTEAIRLDPKFATAYVNRGLIFYTKNDYDRAITDYTEAIRIDPKFVNAYINRGNVYNNIKKDYNRAIADYTEAIRIDSKNTIAYGNRGISYGNKKEYDRAIADYEEALRIDPNLSYLRDNLAFAKLATSNWTVSSQSSTGTAQTRYDNGINLFSQNDYDGAIRELSEAIRIDPKFAMAYYFRGVSYFYKKDYDNAIADYEAALLIDPNYSSAKNWLAIAKREAANRNNSSQSTTGVISAQTAKTHYDNGRKLSDQKDYDGAIREYTEAIKLDPKNAMAYFFRGYVYFKKDDYDRAITDYEDSLRIDPNFSNAKSSLASVYYLRGYAYFAKKDYKRAIADYEDALRIDPNHSSTKDNLAKAKGYAALQNNSGVITVKATDLSSEYKSNQLRADTQYKYKPVKVTGKVTKIDKDSNGNIYIVLDTWVGVFIKPSELNKALALNNDQTVTLTGICEEYFLSFVVIREAIFSN
jgi:tetratricopeptide (TPR) repeat protein